MRTIVFPGPGCVSYPDFSSCVGTRLSLPALLACGRLAARGSESGSRFSGVWLRSVCGVASALIFLVFVASFALGFRVTWQHSAASALAGLWFSSALFAYLAVQAVGAGGVVIPWLWRQVRRATVRLRRRTGPTFDAKLLTLASVLSRALDLKSRKGDTGISLARRRFLQTSTIIAGALPFAGAVYGFAFERLHFQVRSR